MYLRVLYEFARRYSRTYQRQKNERTMAGSWNTEETRTLISIWGEESIQSKLDKAHRNRDVFERIAREMSDVGYEKSWQQCRTKIKNLAQKYRKVIMN